MADLKLEFFAKESHFKDHLQPIYQKLQDDGFDVSWIGLGDTPNPEVKFAIVAAVGDLRRATAAGKMVFYCEHGTGQTYNNRNASYAGGPGRDNVCLFLSPGPHVTRANRVWHPNIPSVEIGVPKLDQRHRDSQKEVPERKLIPTVCVSFHWDCTTVCPETRNGFIHFKDTIAEWASRSKEGDAALDFNLVGHCHPRARKQIVPFFESHGIPYLETFEEVMDQADVYVCDNSSTIFEFASIGKPVVLMNPPHYRRGVNHGLRFWDFADIGPNAKNGSELLAGVREALNESVSSKAYRDSRIREVYYKIDGGATERAANAVLTYMEEMRRVEMEGNYIKVLRTSLGGFGLCDPGQTVFIFPDYAIVNDTMGRFVRRVNFGDTIAVDKRIRDLLRKAPRNYQLVEPNPAMLLDEPEEDFSGPGEGFEAVNKELTPEELYIIKEIQAGASKTRIVYKSKDHGVAELQRAWSRLEADGIIVPGEARFSWEVRTWGQ